MLEQPSLFRIHDVLSTARTEDGFNLLVAEGKIDPQSPLRARLHGVVTRVHKGRDYCFLDLLDPTESIQLGARASDFSAEAWARVRDVTRGQRVYATGSLGTSSRGEPTLWLDEPPQPLNSVFSESLSRLSPDYRAVGAMIFRARLTEMIEEELGQLGYLKIAPRYLSASWHQAENLVPLEISYGGFGLLPVYLAPSPSSQLVEALIATGADKVFASGTSFTTTYRTALDGVEAAVVTGKTLAIELEDLIMHAFRVIDRVVSSVDPSRSQFSSEESFVHNECDCSQAGLAELSGCANELQVFRNVQDERDHDTTVFRTVLGAGAIPVEGAVQRISDGLPLGTLNVYPERFLPLVEHIPMRTLQHLTAFERMMWQPEVGRGDSVGL